MAIQITIKGKKAIVAKGERMMRGSGWRLAKNKGVPRYFVGSLIKTINVGKTHRFAIFSVPR